MGLSRRASNQYAEDRPSSPLSLAVRFLARGRYVDPEFDGLRVVGFSRRRKLFSAEAVLGELYPDDPLAEMAGLLDRAVDAAIEYARKKKIADDLPALRRAVQGLAEAGPAPARGPSAPHRPMWVDDDASPYLRVTTSSGQTEDDPSEDLLARSLEGLTGPEFVVTVERLGVATTGTMRLSRAGQLIQIDRQDLYQGPLCVARVRSLELAARVMLAWAFQHEPIPTGLTWQHVEVR